MKYRKLGNSDLKVSEISLGSWLTYGVGVQADAASACLDEAFVQGINFIDTANVYTRGQSERFVGQALKDLGLARSDVVIATKAMGAMGEGPNDAGVSRYHLMHQIDASLERLGTDHIDLYQIHGWDSQTPMEEALRALDDIVRTGRARYIGASNWAAWQIMKALGISERLGLERFASLQAYYTIAGRDLEREIVPMLQSEGVGLMVWSPLAGGLLSGKYTRGDEGKSEGEGRRAVFDFPVAGLDQRRHEQPEVPLAAGVAGDEQHGRAGADGGLGAQDGERAAGDVEQAQVDVEVGADGVEGHAVQANGTAPS